MVTTIKITCDGVFIQSNSFLTSSSTPTSSITATITTATPTTPSDDNLNSRDTITATDTNSTSSISTSSSSLSKTFNSDKDKSAASILDHDKNHHIISSKLSPNTSSSSTSSSLRSCQKASSSNTINRAKRPRTPKCDNRRRYYFGSNRIYWCKQSVDRQSNLGNYKNDVVASRNSSSTNLQRSASSVTHKELQQHKCHSYAATRTKHKPLMATSSLSSVPNTHQQYANRKADSIYFNTFYNLNKCKPADIKTKTSTPKTISASTSIFHVNGFSANSPVYNNNKCCASDTRLLSFLRSARKLYRNSVRVNNNQQQNNIFNSDNNNTSSAVNAKVSYDKCSNSTNNLNLNKSKNQINEKTITETKQKLNNSNSSSSLAGKLKQTYIFGVKNFSTNHGKSIHNNNNYFNNRTKTNNAKNIENNKHTTTALSEEWFG